jgi:L-malate glycosyltransferase
MPVDPVKEKINRQSVTKTILVIDNSIDITGALKSITRTAYDLKAFFNFKFVIPVKSKGRFWIENLGFSGIRELPMSELSRRISSILFYIPVLGMNALRVRRIVKEESIDLIHVNDVYNLLPVAVRLLGNTIPYVCHIRFLPDRFPRILLRIWLKLHFRFAERIVVVSEKVKQQLPAHSKIIVIHNELPIEERYGWPPADASPKRNYSFVYLSNFIPGKGQFFALQAFADIHTKLPGWRLRFVGGDMGLEKNRMYKLELEAAARKFGISEKIEWLGFTEDVELEYKQGDIVLNFSESESFSITCLEAMFYGRPLIATDCGGPSEIIDHLETGVLVPNRDFKAMADAMLRLANDEALRSRLAETARKTVKEKFNIEKTSYILREVYNSIR